MYYDINGVKAYSEMMKDKYKNRKDPENMFPVGITDAEFRKAIVDIFCGVDWYISYPGSHTQVNEEEFPKDIAKFIRQFHEKDKTGQSFRYSKTIGGKNSFVSTPYYKLEELKKVMEKINGMLWAIDSHTDYYIDMAKSIIDEIKSSYEL